MRTAHRVLRPVVGLAILGSSFAAPAAEWRIDIDHSVTTVSFTLKATMHSVHGNASTTSGTLRFDPSSGVLGGDVTVDATSAETGNSSRDKKMHTKVLLSTGHPLIVLRPERISGTVSPTGSSDVTLHGSLILLGQAHDLTIPLQVEIKDGKFTADARFSIPYVAWGLKDPSTFVLRVAKEVEVVVKTTGVVAIEAN